jgi:hypothetical protein
MGADLGIAVEVLTRTDFADGEAGPGHLDAPDLVNGQQRLGANNNFVFLGADLQDKARLPVSGRGAQLQPAALADSKSVGTRVFAYFGACFINDVPGAHIDLLCQPAGRIAVRDEADVMAVRLVGHRQAPPLSFGPDLGLGGCIGQGEHRMLQLFVREHTQHVALILGPIGSAVQLPVAVRILDHLGIVSGADGVEAQGDCLFQQRGELDALVAAHARIRRPARSIFVNEILDDVFLEPLREVPDIIGNPQDVTSPPGIARVFDRAAATASGAERPGHAGERQVDTDDVVPGFNGTGGGNGGIHSAAHGCKNSHTGFL